MWWSSPGPGPSGTAISGARGPGSLPAPHGVRQGVFRPSGHRSSGSPGALCGGRYNLRLCLGRRREFAQRTHFDNGPLSNWRRRPTPAEGDLQKGSPGVVVATGSSALEPPKAATISLPPGSGGTLRPTPSPLVMPVERGSVEGAAQWSPPQVRAGRHGGEPQGSARLRAGSTAWGEWQEAPSRKDREMSGGVIQEQGWDPCRQGGTARGTGRSKGPPRPLPLWGAIRPRRRPVAQALVAAEANPARARWAAPWPRRWPPRAPCLR